VDGFCACDASYMPGGIVGNDGNPAPGLSQLAPREAKTSICGLKISGSSRLDARKNIIGIASLVENTAEPHEWSIYVVIMCPLSAARA